MSKIPVYETIKKTSQKRPFLGQIFDNFFMSKLIRWETPFTETRFPSVSVITSSNQEDGIDILMVMVAPAGLDEYPKYLVDFGRVVAFTCMEEAYSPRN